MEEYGYDENKSTCPHCGAQMPNNMVYCPACGKNTTVAGMKSSGGRIVAIIVAAIILVAVVMIILVSLGVFNGTPVPEYMGMESEAGSQISIATSTPSIAPSGNPILGNDPAVSDALSLLE